MNIKDKLNLINQMRAANEAHVKEWEKSMENNLTGVLFDVKNNIVEAVEIPNTLDALTEVLECKYIETAIRTIRGKRVMVICDEEGKLKDGYAISGLWLDNEYVRNFFVGNLLVISADVTPDGDMVGLTPGEIDYVLTHGVISINGARILSYEP